MQRERVNTRYLPDAPLPENLTACTKLGDCLEGYSCMVSRCVKDGSVPVDQTCMVTAHCSGELRCSTRPFVCRSVCDTEAFGNSSSCPEAHACVSRLDPAGAAFGACVEDRSDRR